MARPENASLSAAQWLSGFNGQRRLMGIGCDYDVAFRCLGWTRAHNPYGLDRRFHVP